jgi:hypothetical protein
LSICPLGIRSQLVFLCSWLSGLRTALGNMTTQAKVVQTAYNSSQQELEALQAAALETCQGFEEGEAGRELAGEPPARPQGARLPAHAPCPPPWRQEGPRRGGVALPGGL